MMDIDKTGMEKIIQTGEDRDVNAILILDSENKYPGQWFKFT